MMAPRMLAIGTATQDVFMSSKDLKPLHRQNGEMYEEIKLGAKLTLDTLVFATGGNAMNAAVTFSGWFDAASISTSWTTSFILRRLPARET